MDNDDDSQERGPLISDPAVRSSRLRLLSVISLIAATSTSITLLYIIIIGRVPSDPSVHESIYDRLRSPTQIVIVESNRSYHGTTRSSFELKGSGPQWKTLSEIGCIVVEETDDHHLAIDIVNGLSSQETVMHPHGVILPNQYDGVPFLTSIPISPARLSRLDLPTPRFGTYFLHSHFGWQSSLGASCPIIVKGGIPADYPIKQDLINAEDVIMFLQDFCAHSVQGLSPPYDIVPGQCQHPEQVFQQLSNAGGGMSSSDCMMQEQLMDVAYSSLLCNGKTIDDPVQVAIDNWDNPIRLRMINAAGMTSFKISFGFLVMVISLDGDLVQPYSIDHIWVAPGQRIDAVFVPSKSTPGRSIPITAIAEAARIEPDQTRYHHHLAGLVLHQKSAKPVQGVVVEAPSNPGLQDLDLEKHVLPWRSVQNPSVDRVIVLNLTVDAGLQSINHRRRLFYPHVEPFLAHIDNEQRFMVRLGERVHVVIKNRTMHPHPMHLHGHKFSIVAIDGDPINGPYRDTVVVPGGCREVIIAFIADNPGIWALHCHMDMHMRSGMFTTIEYLPS